MLNATDGTFPVMLRWLPKQLCFQYNIWFKNSRITNMCNTSCKNLEPAAYINTDQHDF